MRLQRARSLAVVTDSNLRSVTMEELQLSTCNHGILLEAMRYAITPVGLHYLLTHFDIPPVDPLTWRLRVDGNVAQTVSLSLDDLRAMPATTRVVTMECAGNGRAFLDPRPRVSHGCWKQWGPANGPVSSCTTFSPSPA